MYRPKRQFRDDFLGFFCVAIFILFYTLSTQKLVCLSIEKGGIVLKKNDNSPPLHAG
jgi:hypothetical protein